MKRPSIAFVIGIGVFAGFQVALATSPAKPAAPAASSTMASRKAPPPVAKPAASKPIPASAVCVAPPLAKKAPTYPREVRKPGAEALLKDPLVSGRPILFVVRHQYKPDHHNTETMFQNAEGNTGKFQGGSALKLLDVATGAVKTLLELPEGIVRDPDVSFDGSRILVSIRKNIKDDYHIYELYANGAGLRQITFGRELSDINPIYLPDGRFLFTSTREPKYCMCNRHIMGNLFTVNADGTNLEQIGHSTLHEGHGCLLPDGRVIYDRWEYVDRNFGDAQGVWVTNPDGTNHAIYWGNHTGSPGGVIQTRPIPGSEMFVATFAACHDRPWGALAIVDRRLGLDGREPVVRTWPASAIDLVGKGGYDTMRAVLPKYEDPYPLSDKLFLCSRMVGNGEQMGIYLLDLVDNEILLHTEMPGCFNPKPLAPRPCPPVIPPRVDLAKKTGAFYVQNVYIGYGMDKVAPGSVKWLRVVESPEKRFWTPSAWNGHTGEQAPGMAWDDFNNKRILGTVPVEDDGSVYVNVPADTFVYFQLLDGQGRMVQSMRSGTIVRPGEVNGCVGCHEDNRSAVLVRGSGKAWRQGTHDLQPWHGPARLFSYTAEVQPVFDKYCVRCHDYGKEAGKKLNLSGDLNTVFNTSYVELRSKGYVKVVGAGPYAVMQPKSWGSHASKLARQILEGHGNPGIDAQVHLDRESIDSILTWIDINAPYYPDYAAGAFQGNVFGRSPLTHDELKKLSGAVGVDLLKYGTPDVAKVNFTRPENSPCLTKFTDLDDCDYRTAMDLLRLGQQRLAATPRADMPGFQLAGPAELNRQRRYEARKRAAEATRAAMVRGERVLPDLAEPTPK